MLILFDSWFIATVSCYLHYDINHHTAYCELGKRSYWKKGYCKIEYL